MEIKQFEDKNLAHYSYAIHSSGEIALIDPSRDPEPYYEFAKSKNARITTVIETHPHADFVSSHLEIHETTGATIYTSKLVNAEYPHQSFDEGDAIVLGEITLKALNTPGHSPDSISIVAIDSDGNPHAVFTGDTLFIGDCGRPDLREKAGAITAKREELAGQMYRTLREKFMTLPDNVLVYPAHGAGSLCGKGLSKESYSSIGAEKKTNWSLQETTEEQFVKRLLENQPFIPRYFPYDVSVNKKGAARFKESISKIMKTKLNSRESINKYNLTVVDTRPSWKFSADTYRNSVNLPDDLRFETWIGSIINPGENFVLLAEDENSLDDIIRRIAKIGYETQIAEAFYENGAVNLKPVAEDEIDLESLKSNPDKYTIVDVRDSSEAIAKKYFDNSVNIPLQELRDRIGEIPKNKPVVVHCGGGYRSTVGAGIIRSYLNGNIPVYNLGKKVEQL
jgi:hydroxyacylglutathione hydrolase